MGIGNDFACAAHNTCCGDTCASPHSKCCVGPRGHKYPVATGSNCDSVPCMNTYGATFYCGSRSTCCGDICVGEGGVCCTNRWGNNFACAQGSQCCGDICVAEGDCRR